ncbi:MAG: T9SS type A sorting domain-containing protein [Flavobacteriales bacterium]|nr:T9SS type A sorting domain-containing protein [Flavobacteriales bacterium]
MRTRTTLSLIAISLSAAQAAMPPLQQATLQEHLLEVNAEWRTQDASPLGGQSIVSFATEAERIRTHLLMVRERLLARDHAGMSAASIEERSTLLARLGDYAEGRTFPQNHVVAYRNPVFIDPQGTACAVGWLMIESGHGALAERISSGMNLGYVREIIADSRFAADVAGWASVHGFTADELAWIQPGYPPNLPWAPFGGGTNGTVRVIKELSNGHILIAGDFTQAGGVDANGVAIWNGTMFQALGSGVEGTVNCATEHNGELYLGGEMLSGPTDLAKWNGTAWTFSTVFDGKYPLISALHVHNGQLHAAGAVSGFAGVNDLVMRFDGTYWLPVGSELNDAILALATHNGVLVAAGAFTGFETDPNPLIRHVAALEGNEWSELGYGLDATVRDLLNVDGTLYAAGTVYVNIAPAFGLARIAQGGATWEQLMPNLTIYLFSGAGPAYINSIAEHEGHIYFAGDFIVAGNIMEVGSNLGQWYGIDQVGAMASPEAPMHAVEVTGNQLIAGGAFEGWAPYVAVLDLATGVGDGPDPITMQMAPNPVTDEVRLTSASIPFATAMVTITDASGRAVNPPMARQSGVLRIDASALASGPYVVRIDNGDGPAMARFVKH